MNKLLPLALVASLLTTLPGCFTLAGAGLGAVARHDDRRAWETRRANGEEVPFDSHALRNGVLVGLALDLLVGLAILNADDGITGIPDT